MITKSQANTNKFRVRTSKRLDAESRDTGYCIETKWVCYAAEPQQGCAHVLMVHVSWDSGLTSWHQCSELFPE